MYDASENFETALGATSTGLQRNLVARIVGLIHEDGLNAGARLNESRLAGRLNVSRTPIRAAIAHLSEMGFVTREPNRGATLRRLPPVMTHQDAAAAIVEDENLLAGIARDRSMGQLAELVSEAALMRRYGCSRKAIRHVLQRLLDLGSVEPRPGYGWSFAGSMRNVGDEEDSYRFRLVVEVAAILEPGFVLSPDWANDMRRQHERALASDWNERSSIGFFEMNAAFHLGIAQCSGNRHFSDAINRQNQLRRLSNYHWSGGLERVEVNCREHLAILDELERGDRKTAASLLRRHLEDAARVP